MRGWGGKSGVGDSEGNTRVLLRDACCTSLSRCRGKEQRKEVIRREPYAICLVGRYEAEEGSKTEEGRDKKGTHPIIFYLSRRSGLDVDIPGGRGLPRCGR